MQTSPLMKSGRPVMLALMLIISSTPILTACESLGLISPPAAVTASAEPLTKPDVRPLACTEFSPIALHAGKITLDGMDDVQKKDVTDRLALPDWNAQLRRLFGDTPSTISAAEKNNSVLRALGCGQ